jgi:hypothetical protein
MTRSSQRVSRCLTESPGEAVNEAVKWEQRAAVDSSHLPPQSLALSAAPRLGRGAAEPLLNVPEGKNAR